MSISYMTSAFLVTICDNDNYLSIHNSFSKKIFIKSIGMVSWYKVRLCKLKTAPWGLKASIWKFMAYGRVESILVLL